MNNKNIYKLVQSPVIEDNYIKTETMFHAYISFTPYNISLMKEDEIIEYINSFSKVIRAIGEFSFICTDEEQNYNDNIQYLRSRMNDCKNEKLKDLIRKDILFISGDRVKKPSKRIFIIEICAKTKANLETKIIQTRKILNEYSFENKELNEFEIKKLLNKYFFKIPPKEGVEDYEGEKAITYWKK